MICIIITAEHSCTEKISSYKHTLWWYMQTNSYTHSYCTCLPADKAPADGHLFTFIHHPSPWLAIHHSILVTPPGLAPTLNPTTNTFQSGLRYSLRTVLIMFLNVAGFVYFLGLHWIRKNMRYVRLLLKIVMTMWPAIYEQTHNYVVWRSFCFAADIEQPNQTLLVLHHLTLLLLLF